jgi:DNA-binding CsgD family transcriptional regulator
VFASSHGIGYLGPTAGSQFAQSGYEFVMPDATLDNVFVMLCDWRGHIVWKSVQESLSKIGELAWANLTEESQQRAKETHAKVATLRETQSLEVANRLGAHFRCWMWPLDSPDTAVCVMGMAVPPELCTLTERERQCLELLAQGIETREIAERLDISVSTLHTHLKRAREKLGLTNVESLISFAARFCYPSTRPLVRDRAAKTRLENSTSRNRKQR